VSSNQPRQTKAQRREAARLKAKELREASARRERRNMIARRSFIGVAGLGVTGGLGYLVYRGVEAKNGTKDNKSSSKFPAPSEGLATAKANQSGIPKQVLSDASWTYGEGPALDTVAASAPVLDIYFDYSCSHCAQFEGLHTQEINQLLSEKKFSQAIQTKNQSNMTVEGLVAAATKVNVPKDVSGKFKAAVDADKYGKWVKLGDEAFKARELEGTPTVFFKGEKVDLNKLQTPTSLTELVTAATPTAQPSQQASQQPSPQPTQQG